MRLRDLYINLIMFFICSLLCSLSFATDSCNKKALVGLWNGGRVEYIRDEVLVKFSGSNGLSEIRDFLSATNVTILNAIDRSGWARLQIPQSIDLIWFIDSLRQFPVVLEVHPNFVMRPVPIETNFNEVCSFGLDFGVRDTLRVLVPSDSVVGPPLYPALVVPLHIFHDSALIAMEVYLQWTGNAMLDSVSFVNTPIGQFWNYSRVWIDSALQRVTIHALALNSLPIPPGQGIYARLYFSLLTAGELRTDTTLARSCTRFYLPGLPEGYSPVIVPGIVLSVPSPLPGDVNLDGLSSDLVDIVTLINALFYPEFPLPLPRSADVNADCEVDLIDAIDLINFVVFGFPEPRVGCVP